jgi:hypothetical protein
MRVTLTVKDRLLIMKGLRAGFIEVLRSRRKEKHDEARDIYDLAKRIGELRTGRPDRSWHGWEWESDEKDRDLKRFDEWIQELTRGATIQLKSSQEDI